MKSPVLQFQCISYVVLTVLVTLAAPAQTVSDGNQTGFPIFGTFHGSNFDQVLLSNGNLHIDIPIASFPQRHGQFNYKFIYDTPSFTLTSYDDPAGPYWSVDTSSDEQVGVNVGWRMTNPFFWTLDYVVEPLTTCPATGLGLQVQDHYAVIDPDGSKHPLALRVESGPGAPCNGSNLQGLALDGSGIFVDLSSGKIILKDGTQVQGLTLRDSNGNIGSSSSDMLGRNNLVVTNGSGYTLWTVTDSNGNPQTFRVDWTAINVSTNFCPLRSGLRFGTAPCSEYTSTWQVPSRLTLPDNLFCQFTWSSDGYGTLQQIDLPTGGSIAYNNYASLRFPGPTSGSGCTRKTGCVATATSFVRRTVTSRAITSNGTTATFRYNCVPLAATTVTDPLGNDTVHTFGYLRGLSYETQVQYYQGSSSTGTLLRTINKDYTSDPSPLSTSSFINVRMIRETTILENGQTKKTETDYETSTATCSGCVQSPYTTTWLNSVNVREYDWASNGIPGPLLRTTSYTYLHTANSNYLNANIADRPTSTTVSDRNGNQLAYTLFSYDSTPLATDVTSAPNHDPAAGSSFTIRGNLTETDRWLNTTGANLPTINTYDILGQLRSTKDPNGNTTSFSYSDSWSGASCPYAGSNTYAYLTKKTNAKGQLEQSQYFLCTGLAESHQDQNDINAGRSGTTFTYDLMNRLLCTNFPDGGQTCFDHHQDALPLKITKTVLATPDPAIISSTQFDDLGRPVYSSLDSDPEGADVVDTTYDVLGRVSTVSNPHRSSSSSTDGTTTSTYDPLNRVTRITKQDGSIVTTQYDQTSTNSSNGDCAITTDEAGTQRKTCNDALGHLIEEDEPQATSGSLTNPYVTLYSYDGLGNLTCVEQHGDAATGTGCGAAPSSDASSPWRVRRFTYDSLSRLLGSSNPEANTALTGTPPAPTRVNTTYTYDANGNLVQKTSPAPNQTGSATQTISYCFDALNRVTGKAYSAQTCTNGQLPIGTAVVSYTYDVGTNGIGHLTSLTDQAGSGIYSYDALGRIASEQRVINGVSKTMSYEYNLDGFFSKLHYPSGAIIAYTPDSAGRMISAIDSGNGINYAASATYDPTGALTSFINGNTGTFAGISNSFSFNKRLQPIFMSAASPTQTVFSIGYDFRLGNGDNGNVYQLTNNRDTTRNQMFTYDQLNRLISAQNAGTDCTITLPDTNSKFWGNSYGYDAWGNLLTKNVTKCGAEFLSVVAQPNNQLVGFGYDAAGNMVSAPPPNQATSMFDAENRMTASNFGGVTANYSYDADGNRVEKSNGTTGTLYWYMTPGVVAESDLNGNLQSEYVFFNGTRIARKDFPSNAVSYYFSDHLNTTDIVTDAQGNILNESDFLPWGGQLQFLANDSNHYKFTGKERDDNETGLDYFGARYYSQALGRFITPDWSSTPVPVPYADLTDPQTLNLYGYVRDLSTSKVDLEGHQCDWCQKAWDSIKSGAESVAIGADKGLRMLGTKIGGPAYGEMVGTMDIAGNETFLAHPANTAEQIGMAVTSAVIGAVATVAVAGVAGAAGEGEAGVTRLPQDVNVNPTAPAANNGNGTVGPSATQNAAAQADAAAARAAGHTDIRMNQQQVNAQGQRVGINRPDLQSTDANGVRHYTEHDRSAQNAEAHHARTQANDPAGVTHTRIVQ